MFISFLEFEMTSNFYRQLLEAKFFHSEYLMLTKPTYPTPGYINTPSTHLEIHDTDTCHTSCQTHNSLTTLSRQHTSPIHKSRHTTLQHTWADPHLSYTFGLTNTSKHLSNAHTHLSKPTPLPHRWPDAHLSHPPDQARSLTRT